MEVWTVQYSDALYQEAKNFFLQQGRSDFLMKKPLSLCGRYCISQKLKEVGFLNFIPEDGVYQCGEYTFAISYSVDLLFFALDTQKVVVDVEKMLKRRGGVDFYLQRCGKECLVKWLSLPFEASERMKVRSEAGMEGVFVEYEGKEYAVRVWMEGGYFFAMMGG